MLASVRGEGFGQREAKRQENCKSSGLPLRSILADKHLVFWKRHPFYRKRSYYVVCKKASQSPKYLPMIILKLLSFRSVENFYSTI